MVAAARPMALAVSGSSRTRCMGRVTLAGALPSRAMSGWRRSVSLAALLLALLPAAAAAQSAGDEQYQDPFAGDQGQATPTPTARPAPAAAAPAQATATPV